MHLIVDTVWVSLTSSQHSQHIDPYQNFQTHHYLRWYHFRRERYPRQNYNRLTVSHHSKRTSLVWSRSTFGDLLHITIWCKRILADMLRCLTFLCGLFPGRYASHSDLLRMQTLDRANISRLARISQGALSRCIDRAMTIKLLLVF